MGIFSCFAQAASGAPAAGGKRPVKLVLDKAVTEPLRQELRAVNTELIAAKSRVADLKNELLTLGSTNGGAAPGSEGLISTRPALEDTSASTATPSSFLDVSRIPRAPSAEPAGAARPRSPATGMARSRIPTPPPAAALKRTRSGPSPAPGAAGARAGTLSRAASLGRKSRPGTPHAPEVAPELVAALAALDADDKLAGSPELLAQKVRVLEAVRGSLESQLRDSRFANSGLQTQVLSLQTKFEHAMEQQVAELERYQKVIKEGQEAQDRAGQEVSLLKLQLAEARATRGVLRQKLQDGKAVADEASQEAACRLADANAELVQVRRELAAAAAKLGEQAAEGEQQAAALRAMEARVAAFEAQVQQLEKAAYEAAVKHCETIKKLEGVLRAQEEEIRAQEEELRAQKSLNDSTVAELLQLTASHSMLKQAFHQLEAEQRATAAEKCLVKQELSELSYYAAAGRVALTSTSSGAGGIAAHAVEVDDAE